MKKIISILIATIVMIMFVACGTKTCHFCGEKITDDPLKKDGRYYCDSDCYMREFMGF